MALLPLPEVADMHLDSDREDKPVTRTRIYCAVMCHVSCIMRVSFHCNCSDDDTPADPEAKLLAEMAAVKEAADKRERKEKKKAREVKKKAKIR